MRIHVAVALSLAVTGCDFPYAVHAADAEVVGDAAEETFDSEPDTEAAESATDAADAPMGCADAGAMACNQCVTRECPSAALNCNSDPVCKAWLMCAAMCTCPRAECLKRCGETVPADTNAKLLDCLTVGCAVECR